MTSTSNNTNNIATKKYLIAIGCLASPCDSMPLAKFSNLSVVFLFGPKQMSYKHQEGNKTGGKNYLNNHRQI